MRNSDNPTNSGFTGGVVLERGDSVLAISLVSFGVGGYSGGNLDEALARLGLEAMKL